MARLKPKIRRRSLEISLQNFIDFLTQVELLDVRVTFVLILNNHLKHVHVLKIGFVHNFIYAPLFSNNWINLTVEVLPANELKFLVAALGNNFDDLHFFGVESLEVETFDFGVVHLVDLLDGAVETGGALSDQ